MVQAESAFDASRQGAQFVLREIVAGLSAQQQHDLLDPCPLHLRNLPLGEQSAIRHVLQVVHDGRKESIGRRRDIRESGLDHTLRHGIEAGRCGILHEDGAFARLDRAHAQRTIGPHAGHHHGNADGPSVIGERPEEAINRQTESTRRGGLHEVQHVAQNFDIVRRWNHVHVIRLYHHAIGDLFDHQRCRALQELHEQCGLRGVQMLNHHECVAAVLLHRRKELLEGLEPTRRCTDRNDRTGERGLASWQVGRLRTHADSSVD